MSDRIVPAWVLSALSPNEDAPAALRRPWTVEISGELWTAATDGFVAAYARGDFAATLADRTAPAFDRAATPPVVSSAWPVQIEALREWLGIDGVRPDCPECFGIGEWRCPNCGGLGEMLHQCSCGNEHTTQCDRCRGRGTCTCEACFPSAKAGRDIGVIFGRPYDRTRLRRLLAQLPFASGTWRVDPDQPHTPARLEGDGWLLVIMPIGTSRELDANWPRFGATEIAP